MIIIKTHFSSKEESQWTDKSGSAQQRQQNTEPSIKETTIEEGQVGT